jgi:hypothetical protein
MRSRIYHTAKALMALVAATRTADANGATIDRQGGEDLTLVANVGVSGDTLSGSVKILLEVEHSDDGSTWTDCADADILGAVTGGATTGTFAVIDDPAEDDAVYTCAYVGGKRYVRIVDNLVGTHTNGTPISAVALLRKDVVSVV